MHKTPLILAAALAALWLVPAAAQVPKLDIEKTCHAAQPLFGPEPTANTGDTSNLGNTAQTDPYETCMQSETAARKSAEDLWTKVGSTDRNNCVVLSRMVYPSYVELLSCLQMYNPATSGIGPNGQPTTPATPRVTPNRRL